jgi:TonB family protein
MRTKAVVALFSFAPLLIGASEPLRLQPVTPWGVDYAENSCRLVRTFGQGSDQTKLVFESLTPGAMSMMIVGKPIPATMGPFGGAQIFERFLPAQQYWFAGTSARAEAGGLPAGLWSHVLLMATPVSGVQIKSVKLLPGKAERPAPIDLAKRAAERAQQQAFEATVTELEVKASKGGSVILETGPLADPLKVFDQCMRDLITSWGVDPNVQDKIVRPAWAPDVRSWFSSADYPREALLQGQESSVTFRLLVDATGRVTKCQSFSPYDAPQFNTAVCKALQSAGRFEPAELADGTKVPSYFTDTVVFRIAP